MSPHKILFALLVAWSMLSGCSIRIFEPMQEFTVTPYTRDLEVPDPYDKRIYILIDDYIIDSAVVQNANPRFARFFQYKKYRSSIEASVRSMLINHFDEVVFVQEPQTSGLILEIHRLEPKTRPGELIGEDNISQEFLFDYDMSLSFDEHNIANAVGFDAHPVASTRLTRLNKEWGDLLQASLKLVLEDSYNQLFVVGLAEME